MVKNRSYDVRKGICDQGFSFMIKGSITHYIYLTMVESVLYRGGCGTGGSAFRPAVSWGRLRCVLGILSIPWPIFLRTPCGRASSLGYIFYILYCKLLLLLLLLFIIILFFFLLLLLILIDYPDLSLICCTLYCNR